MALRCAVRHGKVEAAKVCLEAGADPVIALKTACAVRASIVKEMRSGDVSARNEDRMDRNGRIIEVLKIWVDK